MKLSADTVEINGKTMKVIEWQKNVAWNGMQELSMSLSGDQFSFTNGPGSFEFMGEGWHIQSMNIQSPVPGTIIQRITAVSKTLAYRPSPKTIPTTFTQPVVDDHEDCVPKEHYEDLKSFTAWLLTQHYDGNLELPAEVLAELDDWKIMHSDTDTGVSLLALPPEVAIKT